MQGHSVVSQALNNQILISTLVAWVIAQGTKIVLNIKREKKFNFKWVFGTGGMPSSHSAGVSALATGVGLYAGFDSVVFAATLVFAVIVISDAQGFRRASGKQALILNKILDDIYWKGRIKDDRLKELLGHTPVQVFAGVAIGILTTILFYK